MNRIHVLSGDSLVPEFRKTRIEGEVVVFRECLVDGPLKADSLRDFFAVRSEYLDGAEGDKYESEVRPEIEKLLDEPDDSDICLWFEHELFCQVNLWFLLDLLADRSGLAVVSPVVRSEADRFAGWASLDLKGLHDSYRERMELAKEDLLLGSSLWKAFVARDQNRLLELAEMANGAFRYLSEVAVAAADVNTAPRKLLRSIAEEGTVEFADAFREFRQREPVWGFGDTQVKKIWDEVRGEEHGL